MSELMKRARLGHRATRLLPPSLVAAVIGVVGLAIVGVPSGDNVADAGNTPNMPLLIVSFVALYLLFMAAVGFLISAVEWVRYLAGRDLTADRPEDSGDVLRRSDR